MRNIETRNFEADAEVLNAMLSKAKSEQRSDDALVRSHEYSRMMHASD